jgi:hypothetical protein
VSLSHCEIEASLAVPVAVGKESILGKVHLLHVICRRTPEKTAIEEVR